MLAVLGAAQRRSAAPHSWFPRQFDVEHGYAVASRGRLDELPGVLTAGIRHEAPEPMLAAARADLVRMGKFDVDTLPRFLAFYAGPPAEALRVQAELGPHQPGIGRAIAARRLVSLHSPDLAPRLLDHGRTWRGRLGFLLEEVADGWHPWAGGQLQQQGALVFEQLHRLQRTVGIEVTPFSSVVHTDFRDRWSHVIARYRLAQPLVRAVTRLVEADKDVPVSLGHGDLVASNIVVTPTGPILIDWEHARSLPIAADLAKLDLVVPEPDHIVEAARQAGGNALEPTGCYSLVEQVALAHVEVLSWDAHRRVRADKAGRAADFESITDRRIARLGELLEQA